jgi:hypothetical protein
MCGLVMAMLIANLQAVALVLTISVAVKDDAGVPGEWLRQANHELQRIYSEIDVTLSCGIPVSLRHVAIRPPCPEIT